MSRRQRRIRREDRSVGFAQAPFAQPQIPFPPLKVLSDDQVEAIHRASLRVLQETGINFLLPEACRLLHAAGADVDNGGEGPRVRFGEGFIDRHLASVPSSFRLHARNPAHDVEIGGNKMAWVLVASTPHATDIDRGRRTGCAADFSDLLRLGQMLNTVHLIGGYPVEPIDLDVPTRHLDAIDAMIRLTDKAIYGYALGRERILDAIEMACLARGIDRETLAREPDILTTVNANSPLQYDKPMLIGIIEMARAGQPVNITPFTLAGAMAPVTLAGALVQQNAEALAGIVLAQVVRPGAPVLYGSFTSNVDMKTGSPAFGTPEYAKAVIASGQLARRYGVPMRASNVNASNAADGQAVYESMMSLWACFLGHANYLKHGLGWIEGGLTTSFEKVILDAEMLQGMAAFLAPLETDEAALAVEAIDQVGPGSHFFQSPHTMARYEHAFYVPILSDWRNFETWRDTGAIDATQRANRIWKDLLAAYEPPPLDPAVAESLDAFVARRKADGGAPPL